MSQSTKGNTHNHISGKFQIDMERYCELFTALSPWGRGCLDNVLAGRLFVLSDSNKDGLVQFHETVLGLDIMCNGTVEQKLKLFYWMHLEEEDRAMVIEQCYNERMGEKRGSDCSAYTSSGESGSDRGFVSQSSTDSEPEPALLSNLSAEQPRYWKTVGIRRYPNLTSQLMTLIESPHVPHIKQKQFIQFWKSLYGLYPDSEESVIEIYSAIGRFGAQVTKIGEGIENSAEPEPGSELESEASDTQLDSKVERRNTELGYDAVEILEESHPAEDITLSLSPSTSLSTLQIRQQTDKSTDNLSVDSEGTEQNTSSRPRTKLSPQANLVTLVNTNAHNTHNPSTKTVVIAHTDRLTHSDSTGSRKTDIEDEWEIPFQILSFSLSNEPVIYQFFQNFTPLNTNIR